MKRKKTEGLKLTRRQFLKGAAVAGIGMALPLKFGVQSAKAVNNSDQLAKWIQNLRGLTALGDTSGIPVLNGVPDPVFANTTLYQVTAGEFTDQLHPALGPTRLWGYWDTTNPVKRHLGGVIITPRNQAARLRVTNVLPAQAIIPIDTTLPGANQAQNRIAVHLHGGFIPWITDGGPFDWWTPTGASGLSFLNGPGGVLDNIPGMPMLPGQADYFYPNDQSMRLMWYHDHAHGTTRTNAYAGLATGYLVLDAINAAYVGAGKIPDIPSTIPLVFQDKKFVSFTTPVTDPTWATVARPDVQTRGSLWYEHIYNPKEFRLLKSTQNLTPPNPSCIPEYFGDTMLANGMVYPMATVQAKRYRFLVLNACNARFLNINLMEVAPAAGEVTTDPKTGFAVAGTPLGPPIIQIGTEAGFLVTEATHPNGLPFNPALLTGNLLMAPAERADVIIDFTGLAGKEFIMYNDSPGPFPAGPADQRLLPGQPQEPGAATPGHGTRHPEYLPHQGRGCAHTGPAASRPNPQPEFAGSGTAGSLHDHGSTDSADRHSCQCDGRWPQLPCNSQRPDAERSVRYLWAIDADDRHHGAFRRYQCERPGGGELREGLPRTGNGNAGSRVSRSLENLQPHGGYPSHSLPPGQRAGPVAAGLQAGQRHVHAHGSGAWPRGQ